MGQRTTTHSKGTWTNKNLPFPVPKKEVKEEVDKGFRKGVKDKLIKKIKDKE
jgi:hypothetical protein